MLGISLRACSNIQQLGSTSRRKSSSLRPDLQSDPLRRTRGCSKSRGWTMLGESARPVHLATHRACLMFWYVRVLWKASRCFKTSFDWLSCQGSWTNNLVFCSRCFFVVPCFLTKDSFVLMPFARPLMFVFQFWHCMPPQIAQARCLKILKQRSFGISLIVFCSMVYYVQSFSFARFARTWGYRVFTCFHMFWPIKGF